MKKITRYILTGAAAAALILAVVFIMTRGVIIKTGPKGEAKLEAEETVEAFTLAVASGNFDRAFELCDSTSMAGYINNYKAVQEELASRDSSAAAIAASIMSEATVKIEKVEKQDDRKVITYTLESADRKKTRTATVRKEKGAWKVEKITDAV